MMTPERYQLEQRVLSRHMPKNTYVFKNIGSSSPHLLIAARTNRGNVYTLRIDLDIFPNSIPHAFVTKMLKDKSGSLLDDPSASMHTLSSEHGYTRICHYGTNSWTPNVSLFKIYVKCRLWLEMYELHLQTGRPIDYYLNHQS